jgi:hypothetical protein
VRSFYLPECFFISGARSGYDLLDKGFSMKNIILKIAAAIATLLGIMSVITGIRALTGSFDPGYESFSVLISYNVLMGIISVIAGYFIWKNHKQALLLSAIITIGHIAVLLSLVTIFSNIIANQSVEAMIFRSVVWVLIFVTVFTINRKKMSAFNK